MFFSKEQMKNIKEKNIHKEYKIYKIEKKKNSKIYLKLS